MNRKRLVIVVIGACAFIAICALIYVPTPIAVHKFCAVMTPTAEHQIGKAEPKGTPQAQTDEHSVPEPYCSVIRHPDILPLWIGAVGTLLASGAALATLLIIGVQTNALRRQNNMILSKERARLRVDLIDLPKQPDGFPALFVTAKVTISGSTEASIRRAFFEVTKATVEGDFPLDTRDMRGLPSVIRTIDEPLEVLDFVFDLNGDKDIYSGDARVNAKGAIHYTDVFGGKWVFRFCKSYEFLFNDDRSVLGGSWVSQGGEAANGEYPDD